MENSIEAARFIFAFTRDLRNRDYAGLAEAARRRDVVAALVIDPSSRLLPIARLTWP